MIVDSPASFSASFYVIPAVSPGTVPDHRLGHPRFLETDRYRRIGQNFHLLEYDMATIGGTWNNNFSKGKLEGGSILDSPAKFFGKMDIHRYATSFVFRYRALWDKLMSFFVLYFAPVEYEAFAQSKSKKKSFRKVAAKIETLPPNYVEDMLDFLEKFDDKFRTPEARGTGSVRKWSLTMESFEGNPLVDLLGSWNMVNQTMLVIGGIFDPSKMPKPVQANSAL